jgi:ATP-dependent Lon protease
MVLGHKEKVVLTPEVVTDLLGAPRFLKEEALKEDQVGITTGLAWTQAGGEVLYVESLKMKGKGGLILTGQLGDVMKESARAAMSYAKAHCEELGIDVDWFENNEVHVHLPAGAIPKDGPSAGVTLATALTSLATGTPVRRDIAMTGEITLAGRVLPVGGIKEKALAALTHGITTVILPMANKKDVADIPPEFKEKMNFIYVENLDEVFSLAFDTKSKKKSFHKKEKKTKLPTASAA